MQIYQHNTIHNNHLAPPIDSETPPQHHNDSIPDSEFASSDTKKVSYWVEKAPKEDNNKEKPGKEIDSLVPSSN